MNLTELRKVAKMYPGGWSLSDYAAGRIPADELPAFEAQLLEFVEGCEDMFRRVALERDRRNGR